jgi:hypothetical protein
MTEFEDVKIEIPGYGVVVLVDGHALEVLACRAHRNKNHRSQSGPCQALASGPVPQRFQNRYWVYYETTSNGGQGSGTSVSNVYRDKAEARYEADIASGRYCYVALKGPKDPKNPRDSNKTTLLEWGKPWRQSTPTLARGEYQRMKDGT